MLGRALTSGGGLARVDMSDDNDVDMSLFFTIKIDEVLAMVFQMSERMDLMLKLRAQAVMEFSYPMVTVWLKGCVEVL